MTSRRTGLALSFALLAATAGAPARAQFPKDDPSVLQAPIGGRLAFTIARVGPDGTILLEPGEAFPPQIRNSVGMIVAEGYYLLLTDADQAGQRRLIRVQVTDAAASALTVQAGPGAAARVRVKDGARLLRPLYATTARLRALPDEIPLRAEPAEAAAEARESAARARSANHLKQIGLALLNYESAVGAFPPAVVYGPDGKPWHSWRVLILPFLEHQDIYHDYEFGQPWDSPKNKVLLARMPDVYHDPIYGDAKDTSTHYAALVGPQAIFRPEGSKPMEGKMAPKGRRLAEITDGTSNTVMVTSVEPGRKIPWTKPEDIDAGPRFKGFSRPGGIAAPYTFHGAGRGRAAPFLFADGSIKVIGTSIQPAVLQALLSCQGGEIISADTIPSEPLAGAPQATMLKIRLDGGKAVATIE